MNLPPWKRGCEKSSQIGWCLPDQVRGRCWHDAQDNVRGFVPFASNGGGEYCGWDSRHASQAFLLMPSIGMEWGQAMYLGATWDAFWKTLQRGGLFDNPTSQEKAYQSLHHDSNYDDAMIAM
jgi:hypothetical protein